MSSDRCLCKRKRVEESVCQKVGVSVVETLVMKLFVEKFSTPRRYPVA